MNGDTRDAINADAYFPPPDGITIAPSRLKIAVLVSASALFAWWAFESVQMGPAHAKQGLYGYILSICALALFGGALPLMLVVLVAPWPVLRATADGIEYAGWPFPWTRVRLRWAEVRTIRLRKADSRLFGRYDLEISALNPFFPARIPNWRLPRSARGSLRRIAWAYRRPIQEHAVRLFGLE